MGGKLQCQMRILNLMIYNREAWREVVMHLFIVVTLIGCEPAKGLVVPFINSPHVFQLEEVSAIGKPFG